MAMSNPEKWVDQYVAVRDAKRAFEEQHKTDLKKYTDILDLLEGHLQSFFNENGLENVKTGAGTAYLSTIYRASIADKQAFTSFVIEKSRWDLVDWKANAPATKGFVKKEKTLPPGVNLTGVTRVRITRPGQSADTEE